MVLGYWWEKGAGKPSPNPNGGDRVGTVSKAIRINHNGHEGFTQSAQILEKQYFNFVNVSAFSVLIDELFYISDRSI